MLGPGGHVAFLAGRGPVAHLQLDLVPRVRVAPGLGEELLERSLPVRPEEAVQAHDKWPSDGTQARQRSKRLRRIFGLGGSGTRAQLPGLDARRDTNAQGRPRLLLDAGGARVSAADRVIVRRRGGCRKCAEGDGACRGGASPPERSHAPHSPRVITIAIGPIRADRQTGRGACIRRSTETE